MSRRPHHLALPCYHLSSRTTLSTLYTWIHTLWWRVDLSCHSGLPVYLYILHFSHKITNMVNLCCFFNYKQVHKQGDHTRPPNSTGVALLMWLLAERWPWRRHNQENFQRCKEQWDRQLQVRVGPLYNPETNPLSQSCYYLISVVKCFCLSLSGIFSRAGRRLALGMNTSGCP